jgi:hypothetical protein
MAKRPLPSIEALRQLLRYEPDSGLLIWGTALPSHFKFGTYCQERVCRAWNAANSGKPALQYSSSDHYKHGSFLGTKVYAHRAILAMHLGRWPDQVDHINGDKHDNRLCNLREVSARQNSMNTKIRRLSGSGVHGVCFRKQRGKWRARIKHLGKEVCLGHFDLVEDAIAARKQAEVLFGYHPNHGGR